MKCVLLPCEATVRPLPFYLAMEEYLAGRYGNDDDLFFMWQVRPTVIFGRNQRIEAEVDVDYCKRHGIQFFRRKSGGGCVYADFDNIMLSAVMSRDSDISSMFKDYTDAVVAMLRSSGFDACASGRNDVLVAGRKVSGNAVYKLPHGCIIHGTMLFDTNLEHMLNAISPSDAKLEARGVSSVRSRITTLREHMPDLDIERFKEYARHAFCGDSVLALSHNDIAEIYRISLPYYHPTWIYGDNVRESHTVHRRIEGVGEFRISVSVKLDSIERITLSGDYFPLADVDDSLLKPLEGCRYSRDAVADKLSEKGINVSDVIMSLTNLDFVNLLFE